MEADIDNPSGTADAASGDPALVDRHATVWERIREHKLIQWGIAFSVWRWLLPRGKNTSRAPVVCPTVSAGCS